MPVWAFGEKGNMYSVQNDKQTKTLFDGSNPALILRVLEFEIVSILFFPRSPNGRSGSVQI